MSWKEQMKAFAVQDPMMFIANDGNNLSHMNTHIVNVDSKQYQQHNNLLAYTKAFAEKGDFDVTTVVIASKKELSELGLEVSKHLQKCESNKIREDKVYCSEKEFRFCTIMKPYTINDYRIGTEILAYTLAANKNINGLYQAYALNYEIMFGDSDSKHLGDMEEKSKEKSKEKAAVSHDTVVTGNAPSDNVPNPFDSILGLFVSDEDKSTKSVILPCEFGIPIPDGFRFLGNPEEELTTDRSNALYQFTQLVNVIPDLSKSKFVATDTQLNHAYDSILKGATSKSHLTNKEKTNRDDLERILYVKPGIETEKYTQYKEARNKYRQAQLKYLDKQSENETKSNWAQKKKILLQQLQDALDNWDANYKTLIENTLNQLERSFTLGSLTTINEANAYYDKSVLSTDDVVEYHPIYCLPPDIFDNNKNHRYFSPISSNQNENSSNFSKSKNKGGVSGAYRTGWFTVTHVNGTIETIKMDNESSNFNMSISGEYATADLNIPWLNTAFFAAKDWSMGGTDAGGISTGRIEGNIDDIKSGETLVLPAVPQTLILMKDTKISGNWSEQQIQQIEKYIQMDARVSFGPFTITQGGASSSSKSSNGTSKFVNNELEIVGTQIIGVIASIPMYSPTATDDTQTSLAKTRKEISLKKKVYDKLYLQM